MKIYPEHEKLRALRGKNDVVGDFLTWLEQQGVVLCEHRDGHNYPHPVSRSIPKWLALYFEIDQDKLEDEKRDMLNVLRRVSEKK